MKHPVRIENRKLLFSNLDAFKSEISGKRDGNYVIELTKPVRDIQSNKYYWAVIVKMVTDRLIEMGNDTDSLTVHEYLKLKFNSTMLTINGEEERTGKTTTKLKEDEFYQYCERIKRWAAEVLEIYIPDRGEDIAI